MSVFEVDKRLEMSAGVDKGRADLVIAENMEAMPEIIEEVYEVAEDVPVEVFIDPGYDLGKR